MCIRKPGGVSRSHSLGVEARLSEVEVGIVVLLGGALGESSWICGSFLFVRLVRDFRLKDGPAAMYNVGKARCCHRASLLSL